MEKVKVTRYIPGKRPVYARDSSSDGSDSDGDRSEGEVEYSEVKEERASPPQYNEADLARDPRLRRLVERSAEVR